VLLVAEATFANADTFFVNVESNFFSPVEAAVSVGDTVCWFWDTGFHTTTSSDGLWDSDVLSPGSMFEYTFNDAGEFPYICTLHFDCCNMASIVHVAQPMELAATLSPTDVDPDASGMANFEMRPNRASFSVGVTTAVDVFINGHPVGTIVLDPDGAGTLMLDTQQGDAVPPLQDGAEVEVLDANDDMTLILVGTLESGR
jgi:plastocyanin